MRWLVIIILAMRRLRLREIKFLFSGHLVKEKLSQNKNKIKPISE